MENGTLLKVNRVYACDITTQKKHGYYGAIHILCNAKIANL